MPVNSLNNSDTDCEDAVVAKEEMKAVTVKPKVVMMANSLNYTGSDTEYEDEGVKFEAGAEDNSEVVFDRLCCPSCSMSSCRQSSISVNPKKKCNHQGGSKHDNCVCCSGKRQCIWLDLSQHMEISGIFLHLA